MRRGPTGERVETARIERQLFGRKCFDVIRGREDLDSARLVLVEGSEPDGNPILPKSPDRIYAPRPIPSEDAVTFRKAKHG